MTKRTKKLNAFPHLIEQVLYTRNLNIVTPFSFKRNLVMYSVTNSKTAVKLQSSWESSGSYTTVHDILASKVDPISCPSEDIHNTIGNNQKVGMCTWRIREGSTIPLSICTVVGHIIPQPATSLQCKENLMPRYWLYKKPLKDILICVEELENLARNEFRNYRGAYIRKSLKIIQNELSDKPYLHDYIDVAIANKGAVNTCCKCENTCKKELNTCPSCNNNENMHDIEFDPYYRTIHNDPEDPPKIVIGEPVMVNPNSIKSVRSVMEHIQNQTHLHVDDHDRKWTFLHIDGVPSVYASDIQDHHLKCSDCKEKVDTKGLSKDEWEEFLTIHKETHKNNSFEFEFNQAFDNIILVPRPGHIEMNMARLLLRLLWEPFLCEFAKLLGFRTPRSQEVVKNGIDHHRSRYILQSTLEALTKELLVPFVKECIKFGKEATETNF